MICPAVMWSCWISGVGDGPAVADPGSGVPVAVERAVGSAVGVESGAVQVVLLGRELAMTLFRWYAQRRGVIIAATGSGKLKTTLQSIFIGATIAWFAFKDAIKPMGWETNRFALGWTEFHGGFVAVTLAIALLLTVYSFVMYLYRNRGLFSHSSAPTP